MAKTKSVHMRIDPKLARLLKQEKNKRDSDKPMTEISREIADEIEPILTKKSMKAREKQRDRKKIL